MSIRLLAKDLYRLMRQVRELEEKVNTAPADKKAALEAELARVRAERDRLRAILDGQLDRSGKPA